MTDKEREREEADRKLEQAQQTFDEAYQDLKNTKEWKDRETTKSRCNRLSAQECVLWNDCYKANKVLKNTKEWKIKKTARKAVSEAFKNKEKIYH